MLQYKAPGININFELPDFVAFVLSLERNLLL